MAPENRAKTSQKDFTVGRGSAENCAKKWDVLWWSLPLQRKSEMIAKVLWSILLFSKQSSDKFNNCPLCLSYCNFCWNKVILINLLLFSTIITNKISQSLTLFPSTSSDNEQKPCVKLRENCSGCHISMLYVLKIMKWSILM